MFIHMFALLSALNSKVCISDGMEVHQCVWNWQLVHIERYLQVLKQHVLIQITAFSEKALHISARLLTWLSSG